MSQMELRFLSESVFELDADFVTCFLSLRIVQATVLRSCLRMMHLNFTLVSNAQYI